MTKTTITNPDGSSQTQYVAPWPVALKIVPLSPWNEPKWAMSVDADEESLLRLGYVERDFAANELRERQRNMERAGYWQEIAERTRLVLVPLDPNADNAPVWSMAIPASSYHLHCLGFVPEDEAKRRIDTACVLDLERARLNLLRQTEPHGQRVLGQTRDEAIKSLEKAIIETLDRERRGNERKNEYAVQASDSARRFEALVAELGVERGLEDHDGLLSRALSEVHHLKACAVELDLIRRNTPAKPVKKRPTKRGAKK